jgi:hypothetical protein
VRRWVERGGMTGGGEPLRGKACYHSHRHSCTGQTRRSRVQSHDVSICRLLSLRLTLRAGCPAVCLSQASLENLRDQLLDERSHQIKRLEECLRTGLALEGEGTFE